MHPKDVATRPPSATLGERNQDAIRQTQSDCLFSCSNAIAKRNQTVCFPGRLGVTDARELWRTQAHRADVRV